MPPGTYTFLIKGVTPSQAGVTATEKSTTVTWTLSDPCLTATVTLGAISGPFEYTIGSPEITNNQLPTATVSVSGFCTLEYSFSLDDSTVDACINDLDETTDLDFDLECTGAATLTTIVGQQAS